MELTITVHNARLSCTFVARLHEAPVLTPIAAFKCGAVSYCSLNAYVRTFSRAIVWAKPPLAEMDVSFWHKDCSNALGNGPRGATLLGGQCEQTDAASAHSYRTRDGLVNRKGLYRQRYCPTVPPQHRRCQTHSCQAFREGWRRQSVGVGDSRRRQWFTGSSSENTLKDSL
jgi:hypothetical protein